MGGPRPPYRRGIGSTSIDAAGGAGALRFSRYALPPNRLGYCGPDEAGALFEQAVVLGASAVLARRAEGEIVSGLRALAEGFEGAWPYLELIAGSNGRADPLDDEVVAAYWLGGALLDRVRPLDVGNHVEQRFRPRAGRWWAEVAAALEPGARPSHAFHVLVVGPWVGMMRSGRVEAPLRVMDRCRIRWGVVRDVVGDRALVECASLELHDGRLQLGAPRVEDAVLGTEGRHPCGPVAVGDTVSMHWDWVCEVVSAGELHRLRRSFADAATAANRALAVPGAVEPGK